VSPARCKQRAQDERHTANDIKILKCFENWISIKHLLREYQEGFFMHPLGGSGQLNVVEVIDRMVGPSSTQIAFG
jgi:hypothetical protein